MRLDAALAGATERLASNSESPRLDAELLLCQTIDMPRGYLFAHPEDELDALTLERFEVLLERRIAGEPMAYILGVREFWSRELMVTPATLVPRPETELLVDLALRSIPRDVEWPLLDLGTGSGAIAIAIAAERPMCQVVATDASADALAVARQNVRHNNIANVECRLGSWTEPVDNEKFKLIVSNPPYVCADDEALQALRFEPVRALAAGADGLSDIRILSRDCGRILAAGGCLMLEHGADQQPAVADILSADGWIDITCHNDLAGLPRVTVARHNGT